MLDLSHNTSVESDISVIEKILRGDKALFEILIRRYNSVIYKIARSFGFNHHDAEDLMQDTHVAAYLALSSFEHRASYKTWLSRIMVNKCIYKQKYGYFKYETTENNSTESNYSTMIDQATASKGDPLLNRELGVIIEKSLEKIPATYRTIFVMREVEGFSVAETSELLNITPVNVKVRLNRAKALLQKQVEQFYSQNDIYSFNLKYCDAMVARIFNIIHS